MNYIEQVFRDKADRDGCSILLSKWNYDSQLIPEALETIPLIFPHFSKHNKSHSETVLNNVVNVLGKKVIVELSSTDLWLLLESAYCHDLGMVITADMIKEAVQTGDFLDYFRTVEDNKYHEMHKYAEYFEINKGKIRLKEREFSLTMYDAIRFLLSSYFRSKHAENSEKAILHSHSTLSLDLPEAIVPTRLINMMGQVCKAHTLNFNQVMLLPQVENGITVDVAHPRFIACLLRLGDILDIDNNRFSEVFMKTINEMPELSKLHRDKHLSINHLRIDNKYIEINAKCSNPQVAKVTKDWFDWIKEEVNNQTLRWNAIVPDDLSCYLPTINALNIDVEGYENTDSANMPKFTIDVDKAMELLQGKNFYQDAFDSIRELLQNAVDSSLLKLFELNNDDTIFNQGISQDFLENAKAYPIQVTVIRNEQGKICITISDKGIGISKSQLQFLSNMGSSSKNYRKKKIIEKMPDWMRPAGVFGIGFQSVFLLTDKAEILTKDFFTDECISIEMFNPRSKMKGDIYVKPCKHLYESGFSISFILNDSWNAVNVSNNLLGEEMVHSDTVKDICDKVKEYAKMSFFPVCCNNQLIARESMDYYDVETGIELKFDSYNGHKSQKFYYKNAKIKNLEHFPFFSAVINFHKGNSADLLSLDRSAFKNDVKENMLFKLTKAVQNYIESPNYKAVYGNGLNSFVLFSRLMNLDNQLQNNDNDWNFSFKGKRVSEYLNCERVIVRMTFSSNASIEVDDVGDNVLCIKVNALLVGVEEEYARALIKIMSESYKHCFLNRLFVENRMSCSEFVFQNKDICDEEISLSLSDVMRWGSGRISPYFGGFEHLKIYESQAPNFAVTSNPSNLMPSTKVLRIILPFESKKDKILDKRSGDLYELVHSINGCSIEDIKSDYERLMNQVIEEKK